MEKHYKIITGIVVAGVGFIAYMEAKKRMVGGPTAVSAIGGNMKGYTSMMKTPPEYYNASSMEGNAFNTQSFESAGDSYFYNGDGTTPWTLGHNGGDGSMVSPGWTADPDTYSAKVSSFWQQQLVAGSHN